METTFGNDVHYESSPEKYQNDYGKYESVESGSMMSNRLKIQNQKDHHINILQNVETLGKVDPSDKEVSVVQLQSLKEYQKYNPADSDSPTKRTSLPPPDTPKSITLRQQETLRQLESLNMSSPEDMNFDSPEHA